MEPTTKTKELPKYLDEVTSELLEKFGKGSHKPGSGSASALSGLISAKLLLTVISLTKDPKRKINYSKNWDELTEIEDHIQHIIFPKLSELFQEDCVAFDKVIKSRERRDKSNDELDKAMIQKEIDRLMVSAINIPFEIASICFELAKYSLKVFDLGWKAVRGDSGVAIEKALAAIGGSCFVIALNLNHISTLNEFASTSRLKLNEIRDQLLKLKQQREDKLEILFKELAKKVELETAIFNVKNGIKTDELNNYIYIEEIARNLHLALWRKEKSNSPNDTTKLLKLINSKKILKLLGYKVAYSNKIGAEFTSRKFKEIAGVCDNNQNVVAISKNYNTTIQNFTLAHELGHALMHGEGTMFRDIPLDGSETNQKDPFEIQANKFAAYYLMPAKLVKSEFERLFNQPTISSREYKLANNLPPSHSIELKQISQELSAIIHKNSGYSIAYRFKVSVEAMSIRLLNLKLILE